MNRLLNSLASLPEADSSSQPTARATRHILKILGHLYRHLLDAYLNIRASLSQQMTNLSVVAHLVLAMYNLNKGGFIPVQLCFNVMSMIKNTYFTVTKTQLDNPNGQFWLILLGTDSLEKVFAMVWSMVGNDTNVDQLQLTHCIDGATHLKSISEAKDGEVTAKYDHLNPTSWVGDVFVCHVVLVECWQAGQKAAEQHLRDGGERIILVGNDLMFGEENKDEDETYNYNGPRNANSMPNDPIVQYPLDPPPFGGVDPTE
ncbi:hypothetical protein PM082_004335 [Marasmius tenuissimus]|nr:hypothetical protein PM082_004335 [Marasmius tenuissimus]